MFALVLGVLKAGRFFTLLYPGHPADRTSYVLEDSRADLILTSNRNPAMATELAGHSAIRHR